MDYSSERSAGCRIFEYKHRGLTFLAMENDMVKITILVDKGADITQILHKKTDTDFMWKAPAGIRETSKQIPTIASSLGNNLDYYEGGWHESLPGGGPFTYLGSEQGLHGEVALIPWDFRIITDTVEFILVELRCRTIRFPFTVEKRIGIKRDSAVITFEESIINNSGEELEFMWGQHPTFGKPFLDEHCRIDTGAVEFSVSQGFKSPTSFFEPGFKGSWPVTKDKNGNEVDLSMIPREGCKSADLLFLEGMDEGWYAITNTDTNLGIGFAWDVRVFPCIWYWKVFNGLPGYPWYGRTYNIGLEFWTGKENFSSAKQEGATKRIRGFETLKTSFKAVVYEGFDRVKRITADGLVE